MDMTVAEAARITGLPYSRLIRWAHAGIVETTSTSPPRIDETIVEELRLLVIAHPGNFKEVKAEFRLRREQSIPAHRAAIIIGVARATVVKWCAEGLVPSAMENSGNYTVPAALVAEWAQTLTWYSVSSTQTQLSTKAVYFSQMSQNHWLRYCTLPSGRKFYHPSDVEFLAGVFKHWPRRQVILVLCAHQNVVITLDQDEESPTITGHRDHEEANRLRDRTPTKLLTALLHRRREIIAETTDLG